MMFRNSRLQALKGAVRTVIEFASQPTGFVSKVLRFKSVTDYERWSRNDSFHPNWDERTRLMAKHIIPGSSVVEFGAGAQAIRAVLPAGCCYLPSDLVARSPDTLVCDLNSRYPDLTDLPERTDVAVFSGVLEYINDLQGLFDWLPTRFDRVVFSYATLEHTPSLIARRSNGWVNDYRQDQITEIVEQAGLHGKAVERWRGHIIFVVERR